MSRMFHVGVFLFILSASSGQEHEGDYVLGCVLRESPCNTSIGESNGEMFDSKMALNLEEFQQFPLSKRVCTRAKNSIQQQRKSNRRRRQLTNAKSVKETQKNSGLLREVEFGNPFLQSKSTENLIYPGSVDMSKVSRKMSNVPSSIQIQTIRKRRNYVNSRKNRNVDQKRRRRLTEIKNPGTNTRQCRTSRRLRLLSKESASNVNKLSRIRRSSFRVRSQHVENRRGRTSGRWRAQHKAGGGRIRAKREIRHTYGTGRRTTRLTGRRGEKRRRVANRARNRRSPSLFVRRDSRRLRTQRTLRRNISRKMNQNRRDRRVKWGRHIILPKISPVTKRRSSKRRQEARRRKSSNSKSESPTTAVFQLVNEIHLSNDITENSVSKHLNVLSRRSRRRHPQKRNRQRRLRSRCSQSRAHNDIPVKNSYRIFNKNIINNQTVPRIQTSLKRRIQTSLKRRIQTSRKRLSHTIDGDGCVTCSEEYTEVTISETDLSLVCQRCYSRNYSCVQMMSRVYYQITISL